MNIPWTKEQLFKANQKLMEKVERYEKALNEIAEDEKECEFQSEMGFMDYYNGYEKTEIAIKALKNN